MTEERKGIYFTADVHIGADEGDPAEREERFLRFLKSIPDNAKALYLLGDIWDFWYEYRDLMPKAGARVVARLIQMKEAGIEIHFFPGNHDMWGREFFGEMGFQVHRQPYFTNIEGKEFCMGHGDVVGGTDPGYTFLHWVYTSPVIQFFFRLLHPRILFGMTKRWFRLSRRSHKSFDFVPEKMRIVKWAMASEKERKVDFFVFGHFHRKVDYTLPDGARLLIMEDWVKVSPYLYFDGENLSSLLFVGSDV